MSKLSTKSTITITFGDAAENHVGMQKIGELAKHGFKVKELLKFQENFKNTELINLNDYLPKDTKCGLAAVLIIRDGVNQILSKINKNANDLYQEQIILPIDTKYYDRRRKKVLNKNARGNLCFDEKEQLPNYEGGKGRIIALKNVPLTKYIRDELPTYFGKKAENLLVEGNYYYDFKKCGIGFHGDAERKKVIAFRLGNTMPLHYQWFYDYKPVGERCKLIINSGDLYVMSEKASGYNWRRKNLLTLRHAAGAEKYLVIKKEKKRIKNKV